MTKTWGSGRRSTHHISKENAQSIFRAFDYAKARGTEFNLYAVVNLRNDADHDGVASFGKVKHKYRDWLTNKRGKGFANAHPVYVAVFENPQGHLHANWVLYLPEELDKEFRRKLPMWLAKVQGPIGPYDIKVKPIDPDYYKRLAKYVVKGADPKCVSHFYLEDVHEPQGEVHGRRAGVSRSIGKRARKRANYHPGKRRSYRPQRDNNTSTSVIPTTPA